MANGNERKTSETFDNPIYEQLELGEKGMELFSSSERQLAWGLEQSSLSMVSSMLSASPGLTSAHCYSPVTSTVPSSTRRPYEEISHHHHHHQGGSEESLRMVSSSSLHLSTQQPQLSQTSIEVDKLTVVNEIYSSLPCSGGSTPQFLRSSANKLQHPTTTAANYAPQNGHRLAADRPIVNQVVVSGAFKKKEAGREPNGYHLHMYHTDIHANSCDMTERDY